MDRELLKHFDAPKLGELETDHTYTGYLICPLCSKEFKHPYDLTNHIVKDHGYDIDSLYKLYKIDENTKIHRCPICGTEYEMSAYSYAKFYGNYSTIIGCCTSCRTAFQGILYTLPLQHKEIRDKTRQSYKAKTGYENPWQKGAPGRDTIKATNIKKYGHAHVWENGSPAREKYKQTMKSKYGVEHNWQSGSISREKAKETMKERYNAEFPMQSEILRKKIAATNLERYGFENPWQSGAPGREKGLNTSIERYGTAHSPLNRISSGNKYINNELLKVGIDTEFEYVVNKYIYDLHVLNTDILIEYNPSYTHNSTKGTHWHPDICLPNDYHYIKTLNAYKEGYRVVHVWDWINIENVIKIVKLMIENPNLKYEPSLSILKHWWHPHGDHIISDGTEDRDMLIQKGYVEIYDAGQGL